MAQIPGPSELLAAPEQSPPGACFTRKQEDIMANRKDGADAALKYLERVKAPRWNIEPMAYWAILCGIIGFLLGYGIRGLS